MPHFVNCQSACAADGISMAAASINLHSFCIIFSPFSEPEPNPRKSPPRSTAPEWPSTPPARRVPMLSSWLARFHFVDSAAAAPVHRRARPGFRRPIVELVKPVLEPPNERLRVRVLKCPPAKIALDVRH